MIAALSLPDVVVQAGDVQEFRLRYRVYRRMRNWKCGCARFVSEPAQIAQEQHGVRVDRIDVEEVVLHLSDDAPELRQVRAEHPISAHARELGHQAVRTAQQVQEQAGVAPGGAESLVDEPYVLTDGADGAGAHTFDVGPVAHQHEDLE